MKPYETGPIPTARKRSSDFHVHLDPAIQGQDNRIPPVATGFLGDPRAQALLESLRQSQAGLPRPSAQAWERAVFCEAFDHPEPGARIRSFLEGERS